MNEFRKHIAPLFPLLAILVIAAVNFYSESSSQPKQLTNDNHNFYYPNIKMLDTIHLLGDEYIEINLNTQEAVLHRRNDSSLTYRISSGTDRISEGLNTPPGFYTVQTKLEVAVSKQFNNAKLLYWIGFNGNIGFHGLQTSGYYSHLGRRPSSHGCVRIGRDDAKDLYFRVKRGTPVIVHSKEVAVTTVFSNFGSFVEGVDFLLNKRSRINKYIFESRLENLYSGRALRENRGRLFVDGSTIMKPYGFVIGDYDKVPAKQLKPIIFPLNQKFNPDNLFVSSAFPDTIQIEQSEADTTLSTK